MSSTNQPKVRFFGLPTLGSLEQMVHIGPQVRPVAAIHNAPSVADLDRST